MIIPVRMKTKKIYYERRKPLTGYNNIKVVVVSLILSAVVGSIFWTYLINTWLCFFGKPAILVWWQGALIGFVPAIGQLSIPVAVVTWILMLFL